MSAARGEPGLSLLIVLLAVCLTCPAVAGASCPAPRIITPVADTTLATVRPALRWTPVTGATGYRVRVVSRVPEGGMIATLDSLTTQPGFEPPQPLTELNAIVRVTVTPQCETETGSKASLRFFIDTRIGCPVVADPVVEQGAGGSTLRWAPVADAQRYEVMAYAANDGNLLGRGETQQLSFILPGSGEVAVVAAVRARCRNGYGPFAFVAY
ncbi:MAG: hypothetical protein KDI18_15460 [Gammaproteobacteria bacterium]|nr:hypothetical protein [Gammaproteobacteria bacterium]